MRRPGVWSVGLVLLCGLAADCAGSKRAAKTKPVLSPEESYRRGVELLSRHQLFKATAVLKSIQFTAETREEIEPLTRLALADATFLQGTDVSAIEARGLYAAFVELNGDHPLAPYAQLQVGYCSLQQISPPSKDQSQTRAAIADLAEVERRWPGTPYAEAARGLLRQARAGLAESEFVVGRFYKKKKIYAAATARLRGLIERFPDYPGMEKALFNLAQAHVKSGNSTAGREVLDRLIREYPQGAYVEQARKTLDALGPPPAVAQVEVQGTTP